MGYMTMCVYNRLVLAPHFNEIYLMPESPVLAGVVDVLKKHLEAPRRYSVCIALQCEIYDVTELIACKRS